MNSRFHRHDRIFSLSGERSIIKEKDLGLINGLMSVHAPFRDAAAFGAIYAPPFVSSDFVCQWRLFGEKPRTDQYTWQPYRIVRRATLNGVTMLSTLTLVDSSRALILSVTLENHRGTRRIVPIQLDIHGSLDRTAEWEFAKPVSKTPCRDAVRKRMLTFTNQAGAIAVSTDIPGLTWNGYCLHWDGSATLPARGRKTFSMVLAIGGRDQARRECRRIAGAVQSQIRLTESRWSAKVADLFKRIPVFHASDKRLEKFYNRSVSHFILNQWRVPEFKLNPYYSTGGINGGCACCYLWDFGEGWEIFSLYDPQALKTHVKAFLSIDLTKHFAFLPLDGAPFGPWYYINQEKIVHLIYYYVALTGDRAFLQDHVNGKTIIEHVIEQATFGDRTNKPVRLIDYGGDNHHLELRKGTRWGVNGTVSPPDYTYDHVMPDLNARRYATGMAAARLCQYARVDAPDFQKRAVALKKLITRKLWNKRHRWFHFLDDAGRRELRYTIQMFKLIASPVLDREQERGLISHLNEREFLSDFGVHSMSKLDPAFDQIDIDNGGGGAYSGFPPQVIERLYKAGYPAIAEDLLQRILWWGERMPYWGDSFVANHMDYRQDTPLQNTIGAIAGAQAIIFGMFGVQVDLDGTLTVHPFPPRNSPRISLVGLTIRNSILDIRVTRKNYSVTINGQKHLIKLGDRFTTRLAPQE